MAKKSIQGYIDSEDYELIANYAQQKLKRSLSETVKIIISEFIEKHELKEANSI